VEQTQTKKPPNKTKTNCNTNHIHMCMNSPGCRTGTVRSPGCRRSPHPAPRPRWTAAGCGGWRTHPAPQRQTQRLHHRHQRQHQHPRQGRGGSTSPRWPASSCHERERGRERNAKRVSSTTQTQGEVEAAAGVGTHQHRRKVGLLVELETLRVHSAVQVDGKGRNTLHQHSSGTRQSTITGATQHTQDTVRMGRRTQQHKHTPIPTSHHNGTLHLHETRLECVALLHDDWWWEVGHTASIKLV